MTDPEAKARDAAERAIAMCDVLAEVTRMDVDAFVEDVTAVRSRRLSGRRRRAGS